MTSPLLTLFSAPKPFDREHIALIQRNAIRSWLALGAEVEVLLIGDEAGLAETAAELGVRHLPQVARNEKGTPLIPSIFARAREAARAPYLAYFNADIVVLPDFLEAVRRVTAALPDRFLMVGRRWDVDITTPLAFSQGWAHRLREDVFRSGRLHSHFGIDYFVFPKGAYADMPPFAVGRAGWDNWMIYHARAQGWKVIDATPDVLAVHQNHDYAHLAGRRVYDVEESQVNVRLAGGRSHMFSLWEATHRLENGRVRRYFRPHIALLRRVELGLQRHGYPSSRPARFLIQRVRGLLQRWQ